MIVINQAPNKNEPIKTLQPKPTPISDIENNGALSLVNGSSKTYLVTIEGDGWRVVKNFKPGVENMLRMPVETADFIITDMLTNKTVKKGKLNIPDYQIGIAKFLAYKEVFKKCLSIALNY